MGGKGSQRAGQQDDDTPERLHGLVVTQTFPATKPAVQPEECDCQKHDLNKALQKKKKIEGRKRKNPK